MKVTSLALAVLSTICHVSAHYCFPYFMVNETMSPKWKYVRTSLTPETEGRLGTGTFPPMYNVLSENIRCGRNSTTTGVGSDVAIVSAGSKVGFRQDFFSRGFCRNCGNGTQILTWHDGPLFAYLARSPVQTKEGLQAWDGNGDFFKIADRGPDNDTWWFANIYYNLTVPFSEWNATIPEKTPPGFYLLRVESIYPFSEFNRTQYYASCVQVEITGSGGGTVPGPTVKFPGAFDAYDPGTWLRENYTGRWTQYPMPGPPKWLG